MKRSSFLEFQNDEFVQGHSFIFLGWPKVVSEVSFPRFWGVLSIENWSPFFVSVIGSAVSEISRFKRFYVFRINTTFQRDPLV